MSASTIRRATVPGTRRWFGLAGERLTCLLHFMALAITLSVAKVILSTIGVALFLAKEGPAQLPLFYVLLALVAIVLSAAASGVIDRLPRIVLGQIAILGVLLGVASLRLLIALDVPAVYYALLASAHIYEIVLDIVFWVVVAAFLNTIELKRGTPLIYMALAAGGGVGGALTGALSLYVPTEDLLLTLPLLGLIAAAQFELAKRQLRELKDRDHDPDAPGSGLENLLLLFRVVGRYPLSLLIALNALMLTILYGLTEYLVFTVYAESFADEAVLTRFLALAFAAIQVIEFAVLYAFSRPLLERAGPLARNLVFPLTSLICLAGLAASQKLPAALVTHVNAEALSNAIFQPVNNTNYSALPLRFQGRIRTLADGVFYPGGMAIAGLMLLWAQDRDATAVATYIALASALAFLLINVGVAVLFRPTLVRNLRSGIDHFAEVAERLRPPRLSASQVRRFIHSSNAATRALGFSALQRFDLAPLFDDLHTIASQADRETRRHLVDLLQGMPEPAAQQLAHRLLNDSEVGAQLVGLQYWLGLREPGEQDRLGTLAQAPETGVAALARLALARDDPAAIGELCSELRAHGPLDADTCAALIDAIATAGRAELTPFLIGLIESARLEHIQEALITLGRIASRQDAAAAECARRFVTHHDHRVRAAAVGALGAFEPRPPITAPLERGLEDPHPTVRRRATEALARHGDAAVEIAAARLTDADDRVVKAAVHALGKIGSRRARGALEAFVEQRCALGVRHLSWLGQLPDPRHDPRWRALRVILEETNRRTLDLALEALAALGQERIVQHVRRMLESEDPRRRADAVETLLALRHRHLVMALLPLLEALGRPDEPPGWPSARAVTADLSGAAARDPDPWVRAAARVATGASAPSTYRGDDATPSTNEQMSHRTASVREVVEVSETQVERSLFLKSIPLFRNLPLNTLMAVGEVLSHRRCAPGEEILRAGRSSAELFILERGVVVFKDGSTEVERRTAPALFAEESLVEDLAWSRAVVAVEPCRLLTMHRTVFQDLAHDYPEIVVELSRLLARRREDRSPVAEKPSIAVLPFENRSNDREQDYFADGIAEDIITALSRNRWFLVIARNSSFAFKDSAQDRNAVARSLGVRYLLQGSVRRVGQRVRISAQLVDAIAGYQVWADRYDRELGDILAVQDEITTSIVSAVAPEFLSAETLRAKRKDELNLNAWECVLRARWHHARCSQRDLVETHALLEKALALDPLNGGACCLSAFTHLAEIQFGWTRSPRAALTAAAQAARTAVSLDARDAEAHAALGLVDLMSRRYDDAIGRFEHAVSLNPNLALAQAGLGQAHALTGDYGPAVVQIEKAIRLSPEDPFMVYWFGHLGLAAFAAGRYEEASEWGTKAVSHNPASPAGHRLLAASLAQLGRIGEARAALRELLQRMPGMTGEDVRRQVPFKKEEVMELYIEGLRKAGLPE